MILKKKMKWSLILNNNTPLIGNTGKVLDMYVNKKSVLLSLILICFHLRPIPSFEGHMHTQMPNI